MDGGALWRRPEPTPVCSASWKEGSEKTLHVRCKQSVAEPVQFASERGTDQSRGRFSAFASG